MHHNCAAALLPGIRFSHTQDIDEHALALDGWHMHYDQVSSGRFEGQLGELWLDGMQVVWDKSNQAMIKSGDAGRGTLTFSLPLRGAGAFHCAGHSIEEPRLLVACSDDLPVLRTPANLELLCINVPAGEVAGALARQGIADNLGALSQCYRLGPNGSHQALARLAGGIFGQQPLAWLEHSTLRTAMRETLLLHLLDLLDTTRPDEVTPNARMRLVRRARECALAQPGTPPSILELCNRVGASRRKLQYCFQQTLGINPVAYLRVLRLNAVHRALRRSEAGRVQDIALQWGFEHLSRFATDYRQLFGQLPSHTLKSARAAL
ncbi:helix-turn-helix domain-containing protein [Pseudomonas sp. KNUC1026]|uniref:helix-turn-helix domain-containing protein n=1 Tax=Pseudomonas sp. KNUC1026 TaxID=2893890 RepID=UPI001F27201E|nr:helix-turn-helix domain-containing protein [Pseudomonas sp. KNUC1026]UFH48313.1 helix-turn-helix domain-containing protein [Pseudomonas sp. KNUC1026]